METKIVLGFAFGDEGKGRTIHKLCREALQLNKKPLVIRYSGGPQCGHRVVHNDVSHVFASFGSGSLLNVPTKYLGGYIDPISMFLEYRELLSLGLKIPYPIISKECMFITHYDIMYGRNDSKILSDGTCGKGIFPTFKRYNDKLFGGFIPNYKNISEYLELCRDYYNYPKNNYLDRRYIQYFNEIMNHQEEPDYDCLIFEGSQGLLLDMEHGFMPHCTPSKVGLNGIPKKYLTEDTEVYLVTRPYLTRHGNGYEPKYGELVNNTFTLEEPTNLDSGYQGKFKRGIFDVDLLNIAIKRHNLIDYNVEYNLVLTHMDCVKHDYIYFLNKEEIYGGSVDSFLIAINNNLNLKFSRNIYSYSE